MFVVPVHLPAAGLASPLNLDDAPTPARQEAVVRFGRCELRPGRRELLVDGDRRQLQPRPLRLLVYLVEHRDRVVTSEELLSQVWAGAAVHPCSLPAAVLRVRRVLGQGHAHLIRTYQRVGYRFVAPVLPGPM